MLIALYKSKKELKENIGQPLKYRETSIFGDEYVEDGYLVVSNRPQITGLGGREFFAQVTMEKGVIKNVK